MSTTDIMGRGGADPQSKDDRARAAVKAFHRMQPTLSSYARALTGKPDVRVVMSSNSNGHTDGKKIFYRPPLALGDNTPHERKLCDTRDAITRQQACPACDVREQVLITIYHEIGHIAHETFAEATENERVEMVKQALSMIDKKYADALMHRVQFAPDYVKATYFGMSGLVSPFLPGIVNALEDARVNYASMQARKGTKIMFEVDLYRILTQGFENKMPDGSIQQVFWRDRPLNAQMVCALYCKAAGFDYRPHFVPEVVEALEDKRINEILRDFTTIRNIKGVYTLAIAILLRMRDLGFFQHHTDPQSEPEDEPEEQDEQEDGADDSSDEADAEREADDGDGPEEEGDSDSGSEGSGSGEADGTASFAEASDEDGEGSGDSESEDAGSDQSSGSSADGDSDDSSSPDSGGSSEGDEASVRKDDDDDATSDDGAEQNSTGEGSGQSDNSEPSEPDDVGSLPLPSDSEQGKVDDTSDSEEHAEAGGSDQAVEDASPDMGSGSGGDDPNESEDRDGERDNSSAGTGDDHESTEADDPSSTDSDRGVGGTEDSDGNAPESGDPSEQPVADASPEADDSDGDEEQAASDAGDADLQGSPEPSEDDASAPDDGERGDLDPPDGVDETEPVDTGADEGLGGIKVVEDSAFDRLPMGEPEEVNGAIHEIAHPEERPDHIKEEKVNGKLMERAVVQGLYFETPSRHVFGVREHYWNQPHIIDGHNMSQAWDQENHRTWGYSRAQLGVDSDFTCGEQILGPALLRMRVAFADNHRGKDLRNRKSGKVDARVLGRRAFHNDERLFKNRTIPGKKDYFVLIGIDVSGSQIGRNIMLTKRAAMAQATLCARMGIKFAVYAHSGNYHQPNGGRAEGIDVDIYHVKDPDEPWTDEVQKRLTELGPDSANLDGHTMEYYRKVLDGRTETHKVLLYYTDGKMPAENEAEELVILQREIKICRQRKYILMGVGIRTDSPTQHGLETVQVDTDEDLVKVIQRLEQRLLAI